MAGVIATIPKFQFSANGVPMVGGTLDTYIAGSTTPATTWQDSALTIANTNPISLDARGECVLWLDPAVVYKFVLKNAQGVIQWTQDNISNPAALANSLRADLAASSGASLVGFQQEGTGAVSTTVQSKLRERPSVLDFMTAAEIAGCVTGDVDVSTACINAMKACCTGYGQNPRTLLWPNGVYLIKEQILCGSDVHMVFEPGVIVNFIPTVNNETSSLFVAANQVNLTFEGNGATLKGYRAGADPAIEGNAAAFFLYGADNVTLRDFNLLDWSTDGITLAGDVTGSGACTNIVIEWCVVDAARRNGMSIIHADGVTVIGGKYKNSFGTAFGPHAGIDIEPNVDQWTRNISLIDVYTEGNRGGGLLFVPGAQGNVRGSSFSVSVRGGRSFRDGSLAPYPALRFAGGNSTFKIFGFISVIDYLVEQSVGRGVDWNNWDANTAPPCYLENVKVVDVDWTLNAGTTEDRSGFVFDADATNVVTSLGGVTLTNCSADDSRAAPRLISGFQLSAGGLGRGLKDINIINPSVSNASLTYPVNGSASAGAGGMTNVAVTYPPGKKHSIAADIVDFGRYIGILTEATAPLNITLPLAANCIGSTYRLQLASGVNNVSVIPSGTDKLPGYAPYGGTLVLNDGAYLELTSLGGTAWKVNALTGKWWLSGGGSPGRQVWATAAPTAGTWDRGDRAFNGLPTVGSPKGWLCTVSGTPGVWVSEGNL